MSNEVTVVTSDTIRAKVAAKMGLDQPSALDLVSRSAYSSDEAYLDAAVKAEMERRSPEYQALRRKLAAEYRQKQDAAKAEARSAAYKEIRASIALSGLDKKEIDTKATELGRRDLAAGRIFASDLGKTIESYAKKLSEERKDTLASNAVFNKMLRGQL